MHHLLVFLFHFIVGLNCCWRDKIQVRHQDGPSEGNTCSWSVYCADVKSATRVFSVFRKVVKVRFSRDKPARGSYFLNPLKGCTRVRSRRLYSLVETSISHSTNGHRKSCLRQYSAPDKDRTLTASRGNRLWHSPT